MASQFEELAKAVARGASRRQVLRGIVGGLVGAVAATLLPSSRSESVEASEQPALGSALQQQPPRPSPNGPSAPPTGQQPGAGPRLNQTLVLNQAPVRINQAPLLVPTGSVRLNQTGLHWNQHRGLAFNQRRAHLNQGQRPSFNQYQAWLNQHPSLINQRGARLNQAALPFNQRRRPGWNQR